MKLFKRVWMALTYGPELEEVLKEKRSAAQEAARKAKSQYLDLCEQHQQRSPGSHYAEHNCAYCRQQKRYKELSEEHFRVKEEHHRAMRKAAREAINL